MAHYHSERNHQGDDIGNALLFPDERVTNSDPKGAVVKHSRLGGLHNFYHRDACPNNAEPPDDERAAA